MLRDRLRNVGQDYTLTVHSLLLHLDVGEGSLEIANAPIRYCLAQPCGYDEYGGYLVAILRVTAPHPIENRYKCSLLLIKKFPVRLYLTITTSSIVNLIGV